MDTHDVLVLVDTGFPIPIPKRCIFSALEQVRGRIGCDVEVCSKIEHESDLERTTPDLLACFEKTRRACFEKMRECHEIRVVVIPLGVNSVNPWDLRSEAWFGNLPISSQLFLGEPITSTTIGHWLSAIKDPSAESRILLEPTGSLCEREVELLVASVFWANRAHGRRVRFRAGVDIVTLASDAEVREVNSVAGVEMLLPWRSNTSEYRSHSAAGELLDRASLPDWLNPGMLANWIIEGFLKATRGRAFPRIQPSDERLDLEWKLLAELQRRLNLDLPSEYAGAQEAVSPNSMGSAVLYRDSEGRVPWDKIWTSFCDLAMAGGPPHRGKLLESVDVEKVKRSPQEYLAVVAELRRGIGLASGLETFECDSLGWVGVQCDSDEMAAWLLRAILVENVIVRREGARLYLPAGPDFRVEKEIKNVITSVAKTVHYWHSHLRSRQPPKPL